MNLVTNLTFIDNFNSILSSSKEDAKINDGDRVGGKTDCNGTSTVCVCA